VLVLPVAGLALAFSALVTPFLVHQLPRARALVSSYTTPQILNSGLSGYTALFAVGVSATTLAFVAVFSTLRVLRKPLNEILRSYTQGGPRNVMNVSLIAVQVSLGVLLTTGAVLIMKTFWNLEHVNPGFDRAGIAEVIVAPQSAGYSDAQSALFLIQLEREISILPGVRSVASAWADIMRGVGMKTTVAPAGVQLPENTFLNTSTNFVSANYFATLGIPLFAGRTLERGDEAKKPAPVVINSAFAQRFFERENPVGKFLVFGAPDGRKAPNGVIVGVVGTAKYRSLREENPPIAYSLEKPGTGTALYVSTYGNPANAINWVRGLSRKMDPRVPIAEAMTMQEKVESTLWEEKLISILTGFFCVTGLLLAAAGIYGALDYSVAARRREIGIRIAVGAATRDIIRSVGSGMAWAVIIGTAAGLIAANAVLSAARQLLFGVDVLDPVVAATTLAAVLTCALGPALLPLFRAVKTDPVKALRLE
jgi:predicted permease